MGSRVLTKRHRQFLRLIKTSPDVFAPASNIPDMPKTPPPVTPTTQPQEENLPTIPSPEDQTFQPPNQKSDTSIPVPLPIPPLKLRRLPDNTWVKANDQIPPLVGLP